MSKVGIFIASQKPCQIPTSPIYRPILTGVAINNVRYANFLLDNAGENISSKNSSYCELTAHYWAWKNANLDFYGFCHYRRFFSFNKEKKFEEDLFGSVVCKDLSSAREDFCIEDEKKILAVINSNDIILSAPLNLKELGYKNLYEQFASSPYLNEDDLRKAVNILKKNAPDYALDVDRYLNGQIFYPCLMYIMRKEIFFEFCSWLFPLLQEIENEIDTTYYSLESLRSLAHIAERFLGVFITHQMRLKKKLRIEILQRSLFLDTRPPLFKPAPFYSDNAVNVVLCISDYFVPYASCLIDSIVDCSSKERNYDINILHSDISDHNKKIIQRSVQNHINISVRFFDISQIVDQYKLKTNSHIAKQSYYRLLIGKIFSNYKKVIFLDSDVIVQRDLKFLFDTNLENCIIGAVRDPDYIGQYSGAVPGVENYTKKVLNLSHPYDYFQAGVMLLDIERMNSFISSKELLQLAISREYRYLDQDVLNISFQGKVKFLEMNWNVLVDCNSFRIEHVIKKGPASLYRSYLNSRTDPWIIHYAGAEKPWNQPTSDFSEIFWKFARVSPFYETILWRRPKNSDLKSKYSTNILFRQKIDLLFPPGSARRRLVSKIYRQIFKYLHLRH